MTYKNRWFSLFFIFIIACKVNAHPLRDVQGTLYQGLQDVIKLANTMELDPNRSLGVIGQNNLVPAIISPWNKNTVTKAIKHYKNIKNATKTMVDSIFTHALYDLSGCEGDKQQFLTLIENSFFIESFDLSLRGITVSDTDALSIPTDIPLTKRLAKRGNTATDQKSSGTLIPANIPVYILSQLSDLPDTIDESEDSWLLIWREEFGLKFVRSRHIARLSHADIEIYEQLMSKNPVIARTGRIQREFQKHNFSMLTPGTMPLFDKKNKTYSLAQRNSQTGEPILVDDDIIIELYSASLEPVNLTVRDKSSQLEDHLKHAPITPTVRNYLLELHNVIFYYPYYAGTERNHHIPFAWGEGIAGIDGKRGRDPSNFIFKLMQGFGFYLPLQPAAQTKVGLEMNTLRIDESKEKDSYLQTLVKYGRLGTIACFDKSAHMVCLGSVTMDQLERLDESAAADAIKYGMKENDKIPLVATSQVGFRDIETKKWTIMPKAGVFPIFREGPYSSWINRKGPMKIFSFFINHSYEETQAL